MVLGSISILLVAQASIVGVVRDGATARPVAGAVVVLTDLGRATATDSEGRYCFREVPPGPQPILVRTVGYEPRYFDALVPSVGELQIDVAIHCRPIPFHALEVRAPPRSVDSGNPHSLEFTDRRASIASVRNHPLLAEPDVLQALDGGEVAMRPESPEGLHIRGGASDQTAYLLDGIPVTSPLHAGSLSSAWNPDALAALRVTSGPAAGLPHALSGTVEATTREPGTHLGVQGSLSTAQSRLTVDGPLGVPGAGFLASIRVGHLGFLTSQEPTYLRGEVGDLLGKVVTPALGGRLQVLGYDNEDEIVTRAVAETDSAPAGDPRHRFAWHGRSLGAEWTRTLSPAMLRLRAWRATFDAGSEWTTPTLPTALSARRREAGVLVSAERHTDEAATTVELRYEEGLTSYRIASDSLPPWSLEARTPVTTATVQRAAGIGRHFEYGLGASFAWHAGEIHPGPRARLRYHPSDRWTVTGSYDRSHQFSQSLRNPESVVGAVFPVDLYAGAGAPAVPVARCEVGGIGVEYRPAEGARLGLRAYGRGAEDVVLVAPRAGLPYSSGDFAIGSSSAVGLVLDAAWSAERWSAVWSYGWQRSRSAYGDSSYVPDHGATHALEGGVTVHPGATTSIRLGAEAAFGRRATTVLGGFEWEAYNLADRGTEFGGAPEHGSEPLGAAELPAYLRVDLGARKAWRLRVAGRDASVAVFGTVTNLLGRKNVWTYAKDSSTGTLTPIEMRPRAPLVVGVDWRF